MEPIETPEDLVAPFKDPLAELVDGLLTLVDQTFVAAMHESLAAGQATLRLAVNVAPHLAIALYLITNETPPRAVTLAGWGAEPRPPAPGATTDRPN